MRIGMYSITYRGVWYQGEALDLFTVMRLAKKQGWEGIELDAERPHASPMDVSAGIDYVHNQTQLALEYMKDLRAKSTKEFQT